MTETPEQRLEALGIELPSPAAPAANYVPSVQAAGLLFISGQLPLGPRGLEHTGKLGRELDIAEGQQAARLAAINVLAQARTSLGSLDRVKRIARVTGFINGTSEFADPHLVLNGASDLFAEVFGEAGTHSRSVLVAANLPMDAAILVDAIIEID